MRKRIIKSLASIVGLTTVWALSLLFAGTRPAVAECVPVAVNDAYSTPVNTALVVPVPGVLSNDTVCGSPWMLNYTSSLGNYTASASGNLNYYPPAEFEGTVSNTYNFYNIQTGAHSNTATVTVTVGGGTPPAACAPAAVADEYWAPTNTVLKVQPPGFVGNDTVCGYPRGSNFTIVGGWFSHGTLTHAYADGYLRYVPATGYVGDDVGHFNYYNVETGEYSNTTTLTIHVFSANTAPAAAGESYSMFAGSTLNVAAPGVLGNDSDANSDVLTAVKYSDPSHGNATLNADGPLSYAPSAGWVGADSFTYRAYE